MNNINNSNQKYINELTEVITMLNTKIDKIEASLQTKPTIRLLSKEDVKQITDWSTKRVNEVFECPELKDKIIYIGKKMQIEEEVFRSYLQSGPKKDNNTYWLNLIN